MLNFALWDALLNRYVNDQGQVDYQTWKTASYAELRQWLTEQSHLNLTDYPDPDARLALWLNLYNAIAIAQVLESYPIDSIRPDIFGIPNWLAFLGFFSRPAYELGGQGYSLNQIEHRILRPEFQESRIHFALVCASVGCPLLRQGAYWPESVREQLEADAERFINNPHKVRYDPATRTLYCSKIFKWYRQDFLKVAPSIPEYISRYLKADAALGSQTPIAYLDYDWHLNRQSTT